jgi:ABC-type glutathione transport system ATPase component
LPEPDPAALLEVRDLSVDYGTGTPALEHVDLRLAPGAALGVIGESGSGKSTLLYAIARLLPPTARVRGTAEFDGRDLLAVDARTLRELRWRRIALVFQGAQHALNPVVRVGALLREVVRVRAGVRSRAEADRRVREALAMVEVPDRVLRAFPHELSGGMRQRVTIAMSLLCEPALLLADEPTTSLDVIVQAEILDRLAALRERLGFGLVLVSHDLGVIARYCEEVVVMHEGRIVERGRTDVVLGAPRHDYTARLIASYPSIDAAPLGAARGGAR